MTLLTEMDMIRVLQDAVLDLQERVSELEGQVKRLNQTATTEMRILCDRHDDQERRNA